MSTGLYTVVYDIADDRTRQRIGKVLLGYGFRVQKSVFECRLTRAGREQLLSRLHRFDLGEDSLILYRLDDRAARRTLGRAVPSPEERPAFFA